MGDIGHVRARYEVLPEPAVYASPEAPEQNTPAEAKKPTRRPDDLRRNVSR